MDAVEKDVRVTVMTVVGAAAVTVLVLVMVFLQEGGAPKATVANEASPAKTIELKCILIRTSGRAQRRNELRKVVDMRRCGIPTGELPEHEGGGRVYR